MFIYLNTQKVANEIFLRPTAERSMRELAKLTRLSTATVSKICKNLRALKVVKTRAVARSVLASADLESEDYLFYKRIANIASLKGVIDELNASHPQAIILYGSYSKGQDIERSDIDIAVVGSKIDIDVSKYEKKLNRKIHLMFFPSEKKIPKNLRQNIVNGIIFRGGILC